MGYCQVSERAAGNWLYLKMSPIANMLIQIKNAQAVNAESVSIPFSKLKFEIGKILKEKGFIESIEKKKKKMKKAEVEYLEVKLRFNDGAGAISGLRFVSKPSRRIYAGKEDLKSVRSGYGISVVSTAKGIITGEDARKAGVGGEVLFEMW